MEDNDLTSEEYIEIAEKVRSGEYFRDVRLMVDIDINDPMAERYWYIAVTFMAFLIAAVSVVAWLGFYPLEPRVPFIFSTNDIVEEVPHLQSLAAYHNEDPNVALRRFLVQNYVKMREDYDASTFDRSHNAVESLSTTQVLNEYEAFISPQNPESPIALYQRNAKRQVTITGSELVEDNSKSTDNKLGYRMFVYYDAKVIKGETENPVTKHQVDIAFQYKDIKLDQATGKISPYGFIVTSYHNKNL